MELIQATLCVIGGAIVGGGFVAALKNSVIRNTNAERNYLADQLRKAELALMPFKSEKIVASINIDNDTIARMVEEAKKGEISSLNGRVDKMRNELSKSYARISTLECDLRISKAMQDGYHDKLLALKDACEQGDMFKVREMLTPANDRFNPAQMHLPLIPASVGEVITRSIANKDSQGGKPATPVDPLETGRMKVSSLGAIGWNGVGDLCIGRMDAVGEICENKTSATFAFDSNGKRLERRDDVKVDFTKMPTACNLPPSGWVCTRTAGHEGPCAAYPSVGDSPSDLLDPGRVQ